MAFFYTISCSTEGDTTLIQHWEYFREDFMGWTADTWALGNINIVQNFRDFLRENGVFVPINGGNIGDNIQKQVLDAEKEHKWTPQEIEHQKKYNSRGNPNNGQPEAIPQITSGYQTPQAPQAAVSQPVP